MASEVARRTDMLFARGGPSAVENLSPRCHAHNTYGAERDFGCALMASTKLPA